MIALLILIVPAFLIARQFAELAHEFNRSRFGYGALGVGVYIVGYILFAFLCGLIAVQLITVTPEDTLSTLQNKIERLGWILEFVAISLAAISVFVLHRLLRSSWKKAHSTQPVQGRQDLLDS